MKSPLILLPALLFSSSISANAGLTKRAAQAAGSELWATYKEKISRERADEMKAKSIRIDKHTMRFDYKKYGSKPKDGWSLFISMHGGGGAPAHVNDSQWKNQVRLGDGYRPSDAIYVAPRAPTDTWNLWHQAHIDLFFDRLIENLVVLESLRTLSMEGWKCGAEKDRDIGL